MTFETEMEALSDKLFTIFQECANGRPINGGDLEVIEDAAAALSRAPEAEDNRFWLILHEPGRTPDMKGPWDGKAQARVLREFMTARPTAYIDVLSVSETGPLVQHGPEVLQMIDGRSMARGRRHNAQTREAHAPHHAALSPPSTGGADREEIAHDLEQAWQVLPVDNARAVEARSIIRSAILKLKENGLSREGLVGLARSQPGSDAQERSPVPPLSDGEGQ